MLNCSRKFLGSCWLSRTPLWEKIPHHYLLWAQCSCVHLKSVSWSPTPTWLVWGEASGRWLGLDQFLRMEPSWWDEHTRGDRTSSLHKHAPSKGENTQQPAAWLQAYTWSWISHPSELWGITVVYATQSTVFRYIAAWDKQKHHPKEHRFQKELKCSLAESK